MRLPVIIIGGGGHAKVLIDAMRSSGIPVLGITEADPAKWNTTVLGVPVIGDDAVITTRTTENVQLINGIGSISMSKARSGLFEKYKSMGYTFASVVHPSAVIAADSILAEGVQIMAGAVVQPGTQLGKNCIVNTRCSVDHDCTIGDHVHLAPGVTLSGEVKIGSSSHIGAGATVVQGITIGSHCVVAAGAVVIKDIPDNVLVMGVPARAVVR